MDELSKALNASNTGCKIYGVRCNHLGYADDFSLIANSVCSLQKLLNVCALFAVDYAVVFNQRKTKCMYFADRRIRDKLAVVNLNDVAIDIVDSEKYLGHIISSDLSDKADIHNQMRCLYVRANMIMRKFSGCSNSVKISLVKAYCSNIYCCSLWTTFYVYDFSRLKVAYKSMIRKVFKLRHDDSISEFCVRNNIPTINEMRRKNLHSLVTRLRNSTNILIKTLYRLRSTRGSIFWNNVREILY